MSTTNGSHHHQQHHRPLRQSAAPPPPIPISRLYSSPSSVSTPSKRRHSSISNSNSSLSSPLLLLFSLRSLYSLLPFLRSTPSSFSLFPFSFLVSLLSLLLLLLLPSPHHPGSLSLSLSSFFSPPPHLLRPLAAKSSLLALVLLLRFQALRYCGASATILADFSGALLAAALSRSSPLLSPRRLLPGFASLALCISLLSLSWDRVGCFYLSSSPPPAEGCLRVLPMLLPFVSGFLGFYERASTNWVSLRQLGRKRARVASLTLATAMLFVPALISFLVNNGGDEIDVSIGNFWWPLVNTVIFGVILSENYADEKVVPSAKDFHAEFLVTFFGTLGLELFYFPKLSLQGFLFCGILLWISVRTLVPSSSLNYVELGSSDPTESLHSLIMKPIGHILSERKSRKIALFLLINTAYMVVEFVAGFMSNSLGLISDACHMLFDCAALAIGLYASYISRLPANNQFNYGRGRFEVLSGYVNAVFLVLVGALIVLESFERILDPQEISTNSLLAVSIGGLVVNVVGLIFFHEEHHHAHGGGGVCSHSHSHSHSHHQHHDRHDHDHHVHTKDNAVLDAGEPNTENLQHDVVFRGSSDGVSDSAHNHHCCNHGVDHEHQNNGYKSDSREGKLEDKHGDHWQGHGDYDPHHHPQQADVNIHTKSYEHQRVDISLETSHSHSPGSCAHKDGDHEKESYSQEPPNCSHNSNHDHCHTLHVKETSYEEKHHSESRKHRHIDHNMEGIFLHVLADTMGSVGVVISTLLIKYKGWMVADPACSIFISVMIIASVIPLLRNSAEVLLQRVPRAHEEDLKAALDDIMKIKGVHGIQNLHIWNFTNTEIVASLQVHVSADTDKLSAKKRAISLLRDAGIKDITIQVESMKDLVGNHS